MRRIAELPQDLDLDHDRSVACFEYFNQPFAITGHIVPLETHLSVDPEFTVDVDPHTSRLEGDSNIRCEVPRRLLSKSPWPVGNSMI